VAQAEGDGVLDGRCHPTTLKAQALKKSDGTILIHGCIAEQAALHGLLQRVRDIGLPLISVTRIDPTSPIYPSHLP
jgi:hypothetical protein